MGVESTLSHLEFRFVTSVLVLVVRAMSESIIVAVEGASI